MSLADYPHAWTVATASEPTQPDGDIWPPSFAAPVSRQGQITPKRAQAAFAATGLDLKRPHKLLDDLDGLSLYVVGSQVVYNGRIFKVMTSPLIQDATDLADHLSVWIEEIQFG